MSGQRQLKTNREHIIAAALRVVDETGLDGLTIRAVAAASGTPPMSLYTHFGRKDELLDLMYGQICLQLYPGPEYVTWQSALTAFCHNIRRVLLQHPNWTPLVSRPAPVLALPSREHLLGLMTAAGMSAEQALSTLASAGLFSLGLTMVELGYRDRDGLSLFSKRYENLRLHSEAVEFAQDNPITRLALTRAPTLDLSEKFGAMVEAFVAGLELQSHRA